MSDHHAWDTPLLFIASLAGLLAVGLGACHAMAWLDGSFLPSVSWAMAGMCLVFTIGHARGVNQFEMPHMRLIFLAAAAFFIDLFLAIVAAVLILLLIWAVLQAIAEGGLDLF